MLQRYGKVKTFKCRFRELEFNHVNSILKKDVLPHDFENTRILFKILIKRKRLVGERRPHINIAL